MSGRLEHQENSPATRIDRALVNRFCARVEVAGGLPAALFNEDFLLTKLPNAQASAIDSLN